MSNIRIVFEAVRAVDESRPLVVTAMPISAQPVTVAHLAESPAPWKTEAYYSA